MMRRSPAAALFILSSLAKGCSAFLQSTRIEAWKPVPFVKAGDHHPSLLNAASTSSIVASPRITTKEASDELVSLLITRRRGSSTKDDEERITSLVGTLTSAKVQFDPSLCLDGPLLAHGTYERDENDINEASAIQNENLSMLDNVIGLFGGNKFPSAQKAGNMIQCPADFTVTVTKGSFFVLGRRLDIPIAGTGYLRVLYADENLRIFVSPKSTTDDRWEKAGLKVAQINIKCLLEDGDLEDLCATAALYM